MRNLFDPLGARPWIKLFVRSLYRHDGSVLGAGWVPIRNTPRESKGAIAVIRRDAAACTQGKRGSLRRTAQPRFFDGA